MKRIILILLPVLGAAVLGVATTFGHTGTSPSQDAEARSIAREFIRSINAKDYATTCALLSRRFYRESRIPDRDQCAWRLTLGLAWVNPVRFRIVGMHVDGGHAAVRALADGAPGRIVLVREGGRFKVLAVRGS